MTKQIMGVWRYALSLFLIAGLAACAPTPVTSQVITLWHSLAGARERALLDLIDQWNGANPDAVVAPERRDVSSMHEGVLNGAARNALPNLLLVSPTQAAVYQRRGILAPLDPYMANSSPTIGWSAADHSDLFPFVFTAGRTAGAEGATIGIPFGGIARLMFFNRDWLKSINFDAVPADWEQFGVACDNATDRSKGTLCFGADTSSAVFEEWLHAHGGRLMEPHTGVMQLATPASHQALNRLGEFVRNNQAYRVSSQQQSRDDFTAGRVVFAFDWSDQLNLYRDLIRERANFDWDISLLPATAATTEAATETAPEQASAFRAPLWVVTKTNEDRQLAAWRFIRWLLDEPQTTRWALATRELPARVSAINSLAGQPGADPLAPTVLKAVAPAAQPEPLVSGWGCIQSVLANSLRQVFDGQPVTNTLQLAQSTAQNEIDFDCSLQ